MNSFEAVRNALHFEIARQTRELDAGNRIPQETRGWVETDGKTVSQRSKEAAHDYRYFPEPDLPPVTLTRDDVERIRAMLPELPDAKLARFEELVRALGVRGQPPDGDIRPRGLLRAGGGACGRQAGCASGRDCTGTSPTGCSTTWRVSCTRKGSRLRRQESRRKTCML